MKQTINLTDFTQAFEDMGRGDQFSYDALQEIFDYFEELESDLGEEMELDVIAICCDFTEDSYTSIVENYDIDLSDADDPEDEEELEEIVLEYLSDNSGFAQATGAGQIVYTNF